MTFLGVPVKPGEVVRQRVSIGEFGDGSPITLPVVTVGGTSPGPTLYVQSGLAGDQQTGIEINRVFMNGLDPRRLSGTVVSLPVANIPAHLTRSRGYLHEERGPIDVDRVFPGGPHGLLSERLAHVIFEQFVKPSDLVVDLRCGTADSILAPIASISPDDDEHGSLAFRERVAHAMGFPYVWYRSKQRRLTTADRSRTLGMQADAAGKAFAGIDAGESRRVTAAYVPLGVRALHNTLRVMGIERGEPETDGPARRITELGLLHCERGGGLRLRVKLGDEVAAGDPVGEITDVFGQPVEELRAPMGGAVVRVVHHGSVNTGAEVLWVAR